MAKRVGVDKWLFGTVLLLVLFGLVMVFSASAVMAKETLGSPYSYVGRQALWALVGMWPACPQTSGGNDPRGRTRLAGAIGAPA